MAPPSTPAQPRFLLSKRQAPQTQQREQNATPLQAPPQQFASTPRFHVPAAPPGQPSPHQSRLLFSTPGPPASARPRATQLEPPGDAIDTSPVSSDTPRGDKGRANHPLNESIEIDESPSASMALSGEDERPAKRRRLSISPEAEGTPEADVVVEPVWADDDESMGTPLDSYPDEEDAVLVESPMPSEDHPMPGAAGGPSPGPPARQHPIFQPAPRFKPAEPPAPDARWRPAPLPDAFSPQRRGAAKYVPGGLAAEVRDWLVQLKGKGASEGDRPAGAAGVRAVVDEASAGDGMWLVAAAAAARQEGEGEGEGQGSGGEAVVDEGSGPVRMVLAGDGRLADGLGGRRVVRAGGTVAMYQPMWDVDLGELGRFAVACDWEVGE